MKLNLKQLVINILLILVCFVSFAQDRMHIPDQFFREFLKTNYPQFLSVGDSLIVSQATLYAGNIDINNAANIGSFNGLEKFINLKKLVIKHSNLLEPLNIDSLKGLEELELWHCYFNKSPKFSENKQLQKIVIYSCPFLRNICDVSANTKLETLNLPYNPSMDSLPDLSRNTSLRHLNISYSSIKEVPDVSVLKSLRSFEIGGIVCSKLPDISKNDSLEFLNINATLISGVLDFSANPMLKRLMANNNNLIQVPTFANDKIIEELYLDNNQISNFNNLKRYENLKALSVSQNNITGSFDISGLHLLEDLFINSNKIDSLIGLDEAKNLDTIFAFNNNIRYLPNLWLHSRLCYIDFSFNQLEGIFGEYFPSNLNKIQLRANLLQFLPGFEKDTLLEHLELNNNRLTKLAGLNSSHNLKYVDISENKLTEIPDFSSNKNLEIFRCNENYLGVSSVVQFNKLYNLPKTNIFRCLPQNNIVMDSVIRICPGDTVMLESQKLDTIFYYEWHKNGYFSNATENPVNLYISFPDTGNSEDRVTCKAVTLIYEKDFGLHTSIKTQQFPLINYIIQKKAAPAVSFSGLNSNYCSHRQSSSLTPQPVGGKFYGPGIIGYTFNPSLAGTDTFTIMYKYVNVNSCVSVSEKEVVVANCMDVVKKNTTNILEIYPNPCREILNVSLNSNSIEPFQVILSDNSGRIINTFVLKNHHELNNFQINTSTYASGIYFLQLKGIKYSKTEFVTIQH